MEVLKVSLPTHRYTYMSHAAKINSVLGHIAVDAFDSVIPHILNNLKKKINFFQSLIQKKYGLRLCQLMRDKFSSLRVDCVKSIGGIIS